MSGQKTFTGEVFDINDQQKPSIHKGLNIRDEEKTSGNEALYITPG